MDSVSPSRCLSLCPGRQPIRDRASYLVRDSVSYLVRYSVSYPVGRSLRHGRSFAFAVG